MSLCAFEINLPINVHKMRKNVPFFLAKDQKIRLFASTINRRVYGNYYSRPILKNAKYEKASRTLRNFHDVPDNVGEY